MNKTPLLVTRLNREIPKVGHVCYVCRKKYSNPSVPKLELLTVVSICSIFWGRVVPRCLQANGWLVADVGSCFPR